MAARHARPDLTWIPLTDADPLRIALAWPAVPDGGAPPPLVRAFADIVRELARAPTAPRP
jgi:hypothetical protein